jgi:hypothetical protein
MALDKKRLISLSVAILALGLFSSCALNVDREFAKLSLVGDFPTAQYQTQLRPISDHPVSGYSCKDFVFFVPVSGGASVADAWTDAMNQITGTEALTDVVVERGVPLFTVFYNKRCIRVTGTPVAFR